MGHGVVYSPRVSRTGLLAYEYIPLGFIADIRRSSNWGVLLYRLCVIATRNRSVMTAMITPLDIYVRTI